MEWVVIARWIQVVALLTGAVSAGIFLYLYRTTWDLTSRFAKFIITLNVLFILSAFLVSLGRFLPAVFWIEAVKALVFAILAGTLTFQVGMLVTVRRPHSREES